MTGSLDSPGPHSQPHRIDGPPHDTASEQPLLEAIPVHRGAHAILVLVGEIDLSTAHSVREAVTHCLRRQPENLLLDLSALTFCDVCGLRALRWALQQAQAGRVAFHITGAPEWMQRLFRLAQADDLQTAAAAPRAPQTAAPATAGHPGDAVTDPEPARDPADTLTSLRIALHLREVYGQAAGVLMQRHAIDAHTALDMLERAAQRTGIEPRLIAEYVVRTGQDPEQITEHDPARPQRPAAHA